MNGEFDALRAEMLAWQNRRFTTLATSIALVTGILGLDGVIGSQSTIDWTFVSALLLFFLGSAANLTWYAGQGNAKMAAYLIVFHEADFRGWETRLIHFNNLGSKLFTLNRMVLVIYAILGVLSFILPGAMREFQSLSCRQGIVLVISVAWVVVSLLSLAFIPDKNEYVGKWEIVRDAELNSDSSSVRC